jgi:transposase
MIASKIPPGSVMTIPFKSRPVEFHQHQLFPSNIFDLLPQDHECYLYVELFEQLDTRSVESLYSVKGQHAYHPRQIVSILIYALRQDMNRKMQTSAAQAIYKQRKIIVEPVFGQIKNSGFRGFSVRGKEKVAGEFSIIRAAHNFKK